MICLTDPGRDTLCIYRRDTLFIYLYWLTGITEYEITWTELRKRMNQWQIFWESQLKIEE